MIAPMCRKQSLCRSIYIKNGRENNYNDTRNNQVTVITTK